jgi:hypothetical protein
MDKSFNVPPYSLIKLMRYSVRNKYGEANDGTDFASQIKFELNSDNV